MASRRSLVFAGLLGCQIAGVSDAIEVQAAGRKFGDLAAATGAQLHLENLRAEQPANGAFVHGEEVAAHPVPPLVVMDVIDADHHFQLRLTPKAGAIWGRQSDAGIEVSQFELAVAAKQDNARL